MPDFPNLQGLVKQQVDIAIRRVYSMFQSLQSTVSQGSESTTAELAKQEREVAELQTLINKLSADVKTLNSGVGMMQVTTVTAATQLPTNLGPQDAGRQYYIADKAHVLRWTGTGWDWGLGDDRSGYWRMSEVDPGNGWHIADGSAVQRLEGNGTLTNVTLPDLTSTAAKAVYIKLGSGVVGVNNPVAPTLTMASYTPAGAVAVTAFTPTGSVTMNPYTPTGTVSTPTFTGNPLPTHQHALPFQLSLSTLRSVGPIFGQTSTPVAGVGEVSFSANTTGGFLVLTDGVSAGTPSGAISTPMFTGNPATLTGTFTGSLVSPTATFTGTPATLTGTISNTGEPRNFKLLPYYRL